MLWRSSRRGLLTLTPGVLGASPPFDPATLSPHLWLDPSDLSTLFQTDNESTPVTTDGQAVGRINDKSGNGRHLIQTAAGLRPLYKTSGGLRWLQFDGIDDGLERAAPSLSSGLSFYAAHAPDAGEELWLWAYGDGASFYGVVQASASSPNSNAGAPTYRINGVAPGGSTRQDLLTAIPANSTKVTVAESLDLSGWGNFVIARYGAFELAGKCYGLILVPDLSSANRAQLETWMGAKAGLVL